MIRNCLRSLQWLPAAVVLAGLFATPAPLLAQDDSWVGKTVLTKHNGVTISYTDKQGNAAVKELNRVEYKVLAEQGGSIKMRTSDGTVGWALKSDVVPLEDAAIYFTDALKRDPKDIGALVRRACAWELKGEFDLALKDCGKAIYLDPAQPALFTNRGLTWAANKDYDKAIADYSEAIRLDTRFAAAYFNRGLAWYNKEDYDKAIADFDAVVRLEPKYAAAYRLRGITWAAKNEYDKAIADYTEAIKIDPDFALAYYDRGLDWATTKEYGKAIADYTEAIRLDSKFAKSYNALAWLLATCPEGKHRDGLKAVALARKACELTNWKKGYILDTLAAAYAEAGQFPEAVQYQKKALEDAALAKDEAAAFRLKLYEQGKAFRQGMKKDVPE